MYPLLTRSIEWLMNAAVNLSTGETADAVGAPKLAVAGVVGAARIELATPPV
jgi:hypothetical protein